MISASLGVWSELAQGRANLPETWKYDLLIVDQGQDFSIVWSDILLRMLKDGGRATWLKDLTQNPYGVSDIAATGGSDAAFAH